MQHVPRIMVLPLFAATLTGATWAKEEAADASTGTALSPKTAEYKRSDANFYLKSDIVKVNPGAVIISKSGYTQKDDTYFYTPKIKAPKTLQFEVVNDWIEPITPPDAPPTLAMAPDAMQIREPQGDVRVALPSAPGNFAPVAEGMSLVNGAVIKTGANATAAILFGGVFSARLMPNSAAAVQQTVTANSRTVEVDLTSGGVFSKVGQQVGVKSLYEVHTPFGNAIARGTDFVAITTSTRTDVWVAQGTVSLEPTNSKAAQMATADGSGALKLMRHPAIADPHQILTADAETLTMIFNFIPMANQKIASLRAKAARGEQLTPGQRDYLNRIKQVASLIKLALVEKAPVVAPAPAPQPPPVAVKREPAAEGGTIALLPPKTITLGPGDKVNFEGTDTTVTKLKARLAEIAKATPTQPLEIARDTSVGPILLKRVADACHHAKLGTKVLDPTPAPAASVPAPPAPPTQVTTPPPPAPADATAPAPQPAPTEVAAKPNTAKAPAKPKPAAKPQGPLTVTVHPDGSIKFEGKMITLSQFQKKLKALIKATPEQEIVIKSGTKIPYDKLKAVLDSCSDAQVRHVTVMNPAPAPPPITPSTTSTVPESPANNLPAPTLLMHPSMETMSSNAPPIAPASTLPTPNSTPPAGP